MENIKEAITGKSRLVFPRVPEGARDFKVFNDEKPYLSFFNGSLTERIYLPEGSKYEFLGLSPSLTEEQCASVLNQGSTWADNKITSTFYPKYTAKVWNEVCSTAKDSFKTLLKKEGINDDDAEENTGSWAVLIKENTDTWLSKIKAKSMKKLSESNEEIRDFYRKRAEVKTGVACDKCGTELEYINPLVTLASYPPQKEVVCPNEACGFKGYMNV